MKSGFVLVGAAALLAGVARAQAPAAPPNAQADAGEKLYATHCAACHGDALNGGDHGPVLNGASFWAQWQDAPARRLYSRILSTMPMNDPGSLSPTDTLALVAFIARANGRPLPTVRSPDDLNALILPSRAP